MNTPKIVSITLLTVVSVLLPGMAGADNASHLYELTGSRSASGELTLGLVVGQDVTNAVRVVSEPSQTLLLVVVDEEFAATKSGAAWLAEHEGNARALAHTDLPAGATRVTVPAPPAGDDRIAVWLFGTWSGEAEERLVADARVEPRESFELSGSLPASGE